MPPSVTNGSVVVVGGNVVVVVEVVDDVVVELVEVVETVVVLAGLRLLLQAAGTATSKPTSAQRHRIDR